jgi:DNA-binding transcriptional ArsR family regulator
MQGKSLEDRRFREELHEMFENQAHRIENASRALRVMAHPARLKILCVLRTGEHNVGELATYTGLAQATLSQHLCLLKDRGLLTSRKEGVYHYYQIKDEGIVRLFELIKEVFCEADA